MPSWFSVHATGLCTFCSTQFMHKPFVHKPKLYTNVGDVQTEIFPERLGKYPLFFPIFLEKFPLVRSLQWVQFRVQLCTITEYVHSWVRYCSQLMNWFFVRHCARIRAQLYTNSCTSCVCMNQCTTMHNIIVRTPLERGRVLFVSSV